MTDTTSQARLNELLTAWKAKLQLWAQDGSLVAAAQEALVLSGTPSALKALVGQWGTGDFSGLPPIVLLSAADINGAMGAYAISTATIYLNADWLAGATQDQANAVLTEELGHHLDASLNALDTPGDEGEYFARLLAEENLDATTCSALRKQQDHGSVQINAQVLNAELAASPPFQVVLQATTGTNTDMPLGDGTSIRLSDGTLVLASNKDMGLVSAPYGGGDILGKGGDQFHQSHDRRQNSERHYLWNRQDNHQWNCRHTRQRLHCLWRGQRITIRLSFWRRA